jgi:hypothetical protein
MKCLTCTLGHLLLVVITVRWLMALIVILCAAWVFGAVVWFAFSIS